MAQPLAEIAVVGKDNQAFGIPVQPADRVEPTQGTRHKVNYLLFRKRVFQGAGETDRLIHGKVNKLFRNNPFAVDANLVLARDFPGRNQDCFTVHAHAAGLNQFRGLPAGGGAAPRQVEIEFHIDSYYNPI